MKAVTLTLVVIAASHFILGRPTEKTIIRTHAILPEDAQRKEHATKVVEAVGRSGETYPILREITYFHMNEIPYEKYTHKTSNDDPPIFEDHDAVHFDQRYPTNAHGHYVPEVEPPPEPAPEAVLSETAKEEVPLASTEATHQSISTNTEASVEIESDTAKITRRKRSPLERYQEQKGLTSKTRRHFGAKSANGQSAYPSDDTTSLSETRVETRPGQWSMVLPSKHPVLNRLSEPIDSTTASGLRFRTKNLRRPSNPNNDEEIQYNNARKANVFNVIKTEYITPLAHINPTTPNTEASNKTIDEYSYYDYVDKEDKSETVNENNSKKEENREDDENPEAGQNSELDDSQSNPNFNEGNEYSETNKQIKQNVETSDANVNYPDDGEENSETVNENNSEKESNSEVHQNSGAGQNSELDDSQSNPNVNEGDEYSETNKQIKENVESSDANVYYPDDVEENSENHHEILNSGNASTNNKEQNPLTADKKVSENSNSNHKQSLSKAHKKIISSKTPRRHGNETPKSLNTEEILEHINPELFDDDEFKNLGRALGPFRKHKLHIQSKTQDKNKHNENLTNYKVKVKKLEKQPVEKVTTTKKEKESKNRCKKNDKKFHHKRPESGSSEENSVELVDMKERPTALTSPHIINYVDKKKITNIFIFYPDEASESSEGEREESFNIDIRRAKVNKMSGTKSNNTVTTEKKDHVKELKINKTISESIENMNQTSYNSESVLTQNRVENPEPKSETLLLKESELESVSPQDEPKPTPEKPKSDFLVTKSKTKLNTVAPETSKHESVAPKEKNESKSGAAKVEAKSNSVVLETSDSKSGAAKEDPEFKSSTVALETSKSETVAFETSKSESGATKEEAKSESVVLETSDSKSGAAKEDPEFKSSTVAFETSKSESGATKEEAKSESVVLETSSAAKEDPEFKSSTVALETSKSESVAFETSKSESGAAKEAQETRSESVASDN